MIQVIEVFRSIQGESTWQGLPCTFIRLTGCNLRCTYCDTTYAYDGGSTRSIESLVDEARALGLELVEITGGEPLMQPDTPALAKALLDAGHRVLIETNGSLDISSIDHRAVIVMDIKTPSSGMSGSMRLENIAHLKRTDELKFVLSDRADYEWARAVIRERSLEGMCVILLSPVYGKLQPRELSAWILEDGLKARLNLQLHKYIFGPDERGV